VSVHCCEEPCRTLRSISKHEGYGGVLLGFASLRRCASFTQSARVEEAHRWVGVYGEARRVHCCDSHPCCDRRVDHKLGSSHTLRAANPEQQVHSKLSLRRAVNTVQRVEWRVSEPTIRVWRSGTTSTQPANLAVESAEESLTILPDYAPTVRPPPKRS
jgi:hypothetical protein